MTNQALTDESPMPYGKYEGVQMAEIQATYLIYLYENDKCSQVVYDYILSNMDTLKLEIEQSKRFGKAWNNYNAK